MRLPNLAVLRQAKHEFFRINSPPSIPLATKDVGVVEISDRSSAICHNLILPNVLQQFKIVGLPISFQCFDPHSAKIALETIAVLVLTGLGSLPREAPTHF